MPTPTGTMDLADEELAPESIDEAWDADELSIDEGDIRELGAYSGWESDSRTLVGIGRPPKRRRNAAENALSQRMPQSEPPGPFIADDDELPPSFRTKGLGIWTVAVPALVVAAAAAVLVLRGLGSSGAPPAHHAAVQAVPEENAGLMVKIAAADAHVLLDGQDRGVAPVLLMGLKPGSHVLSVVSSAHEPFEQPLTLLADHVSTIEPTLTLRASSPSTEENLSPSAPAAEAKSAPAHGAALAATRGAKPAAPIAGGAPIAPVSPVPAPAVTGTPTSGVPALPAPGAVAGPTGSLNITSIPPSNIVLDGRPLGKAPRVVDVAPGPHTVVFVHPTLGRQSVSVRVTAGKSASASADF